MTAALGTEGDAPAAGAGTDVHGSAVPEVVIAAVVIVIATLLSIFAKIDSGIRMLKERAAQGKLFCSC